jgi:hypothetical protein
MDIKEFLSPADAQVDVTASDKAELLQELADRATNSLSLPSDRILNELLKRENSDQRAPAAGLPSPTRAYQASISRLAFWFALSSLLTLMLLMVSRLICCFYCSFPSPRIRSNLMLLPPSPEY